MGGIPKHPLKSCVLGLILLMAEILHQLIGSFPIICKVFTSQVVQDFSHQQYERFGLLFLRKFSVFSFLFFVFVGGYTFKNAFIWEKFFPLIFFCPLMGWLNHQLYSATCIASHGVSTGSIAHLDPETKGGS